VLQKRIDVMSFTMMYLQLLLHLAAIHRKQVVMITRIQLVTIMMVVLLFLPQPGLVWMLPLNQWIAQFISLY